MLFGWIADGKSGIMGVRQKGGSYSSVVENSEYIEEGLYVPNVMYLFTHLVTYGWLFIGHLLDSY